MHFKQIKTIQDASVLLGIDYCDPSELGFIISEQFSKSLAAACEIAVIATAINKLDTNNHNNEDGYFCPLFLVQGDEFSFGGVRVAYTSRSMPHVHCYRSREAATYAGQQFIAHYRNMILP